MVEVGGVGEVGLPAGRGVPEDVALDALVVVVGNRQTVAGAGPGGNDRFSRGVSAGERRDEQFKLLVGILWTTTWPAALERIEATTIR